MEEFKEYFKFPLIHENDFLYVLTKDGDPVLTWATTSDEIGEDPNDIINKINGYSTKKFKKTWNIREKVFIYYGDKKIFFIRGCHLLTNNNKYSLSHEKAQKLQTNFGKYIVDTLNK